MDDALDCFSQDQLEASPLIFIHDKEELDHWLQFHIPDASSPLKSPDVARFFSEQFDKLAGGWMMTEEEAKRDGIPVTHGCRFRSNEPCVSLNPASL